MIVAAVLAAGIGLGLVVIARAWAPAPRPLHEIAAELREPRSAGVTHAGVQGWWSRLALRSMGKPSKQMLADLRVIGRTPARHALDKAGYSGIFAIIGLVPAIMWPAFDVAVPVWVLLIGVGLLALFGYVYPDIELRSKAARARKAWSQAISAYLDVVGIALAGGAGVEDAMIDAAKIGTGSQMAELHETLHAAQVRRRNLWSELEQLGRDADISSLRELAGAMHLAGESGTRVRETLVAKANALRSRQLTDAETEANKASETMGVAPALMAIAAVLLVAYPAVHQLTN